MVGPGDLNHAGQQTREDADNKEHQPALPRCRGEPWTGTRAPLQTGVTCPALMKSAAIRRHCGTSEEARSYYKAAAPLVLFPQIIGLR